MEVNGIEEKKIGAPGTLKKEKSKASGWDNIFIKKHVDIGVAKKDKPADTSDNVTVEHIITKNIMV